MTAATDLDKTSTSRAIRFFTNQISGKPDNTVALVYYAGHGLQVDGENFLIPVDATVSREADVPLETMRLADLMAMLDTVRSKTRIVILDACRDNPFADIAKSGAARAGAGECAGGYAGRLFYLAGRHRRRWIGEQFAVCAGVAQISQGAGAADRSRAEECAARRAWRDWRTADALGSFGADRAVLVLPGSAPLKQDASRGKSAEAWRKELQGLSPRDAFDITVREDDVTVYEQYLALYGSDPLATQVRSIVDRRQMMIAWLEAVTLNTPAAFCGFPCALSRQRSDADGTAA